MDGDLNIRDLSLSHIDLTEAIGPQTSFPIAPAGVVVMERKMSSSNSPCAACKFLRRKCTQECVFAPYFPPDNPQKFTNVHKVFGASNVAKLLNELNASHREDAVNSLAYEAEYRLRDPVYGCVGLISILQHKLKQVQHDLDNAKKELATYIGPSAMLPIINHQGFLHQHPNYGASAYQVMPHNMQPMMGVPSGLPHGALLIRDSQQQPPPQQHQILEAQQLVAAARDQEIGFDTTGGTATATVFNHMIPATAAAADDDMQPALALGSYESNPYGHHIQQQAEEHPHSHHPHQLELLLQQQNATIHHQTQQLQTSQAQRARSEEGRSVDH
ncbi:LOB domain-containing protein 36 [Forsythia ovata]|uniref:LOB domain-containing protein 36 n=1 Tax=Forsythia ovata TaxID=205694 RepID=A0ABD1UCS0_9LAMI